MSCRRRGPGHRRIKLHRTYTIAEAADVVGGHRNTVRHPVIAEKRPTLIRGEDLKAFLLKRHRDRKRPCAPGQIFCVKCRMPREPALGMADFAPASTGLGTLAGLCPVCGTIIKRWVSRNRLVEVSGKLDVKITAPQSRLSDIPHPPSECYFEPGS
jgi:hypothetical protein